MTVGTLQEEVEKVIANTTDPSWRPRFRRCLPKLAEAMRGWHGEKAGEFLLACATPSKGLMLWVAAWPLGLDEKMLPRHQVATALVEAIESPTFQGDVIVGATTLLLGEALDEQRASCDQINAEGNTALVVTLAEQQADIAFLVMVIPMGRPTVH